MALTYRSITYPSDHWALHYPQKSDPNFIARFRYRDVELVAKVNTTDSRGYRSIVGLCDPKMETTFNRPYTFDEKIALHLALGVVAQAYENLGLIAQVEIAGNNSQSLEEGIVYLGNVKEPSLLHGHIIGRGNPNNDYVKGVPLHGPKPGEMFNMRGDDLRVPGNDKKTKWTPEEMNAVRLALASDILTITETEKVPQYKGERMYLV